MKFLGPRWGHFYLSLGQTASRSRVQQRSIWVSDYQVQKISLRVLGQVTIPKKWNFGATVRPLLFDPSANCLYVWGSSCRCCMSGDALVGEVLAIGWVMLMNDFLELWMDQVFEKDFFKVSRLGCNPTYLWDTLYTESWVLRLSTCTYVDENEAVFPLSEDTDAATVAIVEKHLRHFDYGTVL